MPTQRILKASLLAVSITAIAACAPTHSLRSSTMLSVPHYGNFSQAEVEQLKNVRTIYFDTNSTEIKPEYQRALAVQAILLTQDWIKNKNTQDAQSLTIEGHADVRGSEKGNMRLAEMRAIAIAQFLRNQGVNPKRLNVATYGEERPVTSLTDKKQADTASRRAIIRYNNHAVLDPNNGHYSQYYYHENPASNNFTKDVNYNN